MKIIIAPDSFKHSMSASEAAAAIARGVRIELPGAEVVEFPVADGGEGSAAAILAAARIASLGGEKIAHKVSGPDFCEVDSYYVSVGGTAVIEMAAICGLTMTGRLNPEQTTTLGVGEMIKKALDDGFGCDRGGGIRRILLCAGGSATNDAGIGALTALGAVFRDSGNREVIPCGGSLAEIGSADFSRLDPRLRECEMVIACDVDNPLFGERGAAYVFAPQKGADAEMVVRLDAGLRNIARFYGSHAGTDIASIPGSGAAGGITAGFIAACRASLQPGIDLILGVSGFDETAAGASLIITGEGKTDTQTLGGKAVLGVAKRAARLGVPAIVISGSIDGEVDRALYDCGVTSVFSTCRLTDRFDKIKDKCPEWLELTARNIIRTCIIDPPIKYYF